MKCREIFLVLATACIVISGSILIGQAPQGTPATLSQGGYSIFHETMVDMTYQDVEDAAKQNTIVLWPMGVIEEHGPFGDPAAATPALGGRAHAASTVRAAEAISRHFESQPWSK